MYVREGIETHIRQRAGSRVGKGGWEGGDHKGFICIISFLIGHSDLQGDGLLVAEREQRHTFLPSDRQKKL